MIPRQKICRVRVSSRTKIRIRVSGLGSLGCRSVQAVLVQPVGIELPRPEFWGKGLGFRGLGFDFRVWGRSKVCIF